jgi:winged helix-turn-helix protein/methyltransferase family protein
MCVGCQLTKVDSTEVFGERILGIMNNAALAMMFSIGHRTGLFDTLAELRPSSSVEISKQAGLSERYVREWLGAMVVGGVVLYQAEADTYELPASHASLLTRDAGSDNLAVLCQYFSVLGAVEDEVVDCFKKGGGVPYSSYPRFQEVMAADSGQSVVPALMDDILPLVPGLLEKLENGIEVLDVGCGQGRALALMAQRFPKSRFTGYDISPDGIAAAQAMAEDQGLTNLHFYRQDAAQFTDENRFHLILTFDAVHDQAAPDQVLFNIRRALHPEGVYLMQDIDMHSHLDGNLEHPLGPLLYTISCMHCMTVSLAAGGAGLGATWGNELATSMLGNAGFNSIRIERLPHDIQNCYYISTH